MPKNAQEWLDQNYPPEQRKNHQTLEIDRRYLEGSLDLRDFVNLEILKCECNNLTSLDLSNCLKLTEIYCQCNKLISLNLENNPQLVKLDCSVNKLASLDLSNCQELTEINLSHNQLTSIDISQNVNLEKLECEWNKLTSLDLSNNPQLRFLNCNSNLLTDLNTSANPLLETLWCRNWQRTNSLTNLDLSKNANLQSLYCYHNPKITKLDLSHNSHLTDLLCDYSLYPNITGLENTSIVDLRFAETISQAPTSNPQAIWKTLMDINKKHFPELDLIDISDLDELVDQVNENTVSDGELLIQIFPHLKTKEKCVKFSEFHRKDKGYFYWLSLIFDELLSRIINRLLIYQNRLYEGKDEEWEQKISGWPRVLPLVPKNLAAASVSTRQELVNKVLNGDEELSSRISDLLWEENSKMKRRKAELTEQLTKTQQELKTEKEAHEQTKNTQPSFLKTLATYGFLPSVLGNLLLVILLFRNQKKPVKFRLPTKPKKTNQATNKSTQEELPPQWTEHSAEK